MNRYRIIITHNPPRPGDSPFIPDESLEMKRRRELARQLQLEATRRAGTKIPSRGFQESLFDDVKTTDAKGQISLF